MKKNLSIFFKGICMGAADVVPGVSGGTMALILGIYQRLLLAIRHFDLPLLTLLRRRQFSQATRHIDLTFLCVLFAGIATAIFFFTRIVPLPKLILTHPELVYGLFFGLLIASIVVLLIEQPPRKLTQLGWIALGLLIGFSVVHLIPQQTPDATWFIILCGAIAISAMILPGISGSFILLILQKYAYIFDALGRLDFSIIIPFAVGCVGGLMLFSRFLSWLLRRFYDATLLTIIGVLTGSLWVIWPFQDRSFELVRGKQRLIHSTPTLPSELDSNVVAAFGLAVAGAIAVLLIHHFASRNATKHA